MDEDMLEYVYNLIERDVRHNGMTEIAELTLVELEFQMSELESRS